MSPFNKSFILKCLLLTISSNCETSRCFSALQVLPPSTNFARQTIGFLHRFPPAKVNQANIPLCRQTIRFRLKLIAAYVLARVSEFPSCT